MARKSARPASTSVSPEDLAALMSKHLTKVDHCTFAGTCVESVHKNNVVFFAALLSHTHRLNLQTVKAALQTISPGMSPFQKQQIAKLLTTSLSQLNRKRANAKNGTKLPQFYNKIFGQERGPKPKADLAERNVSKSIPVFEKSGGAELHGLPIADNAELIGSSQESNKRLQKDMPSWWNTAKLQMESQEALSQAPIFANMECGGSGYLLAHWPDGSSEQTDVSNMALEADALAITKKPSCRQTVAKKPATTGNRQSVSFGSLRKHVGDDKGYIQYLHEGRWLCLVHVSGKCCDMHHSILIDELLDYACSSSLITREQVLERKQALAAALAN